MAEKSSLTWLELILIVVVVLSTFLVWSGANQFVEGHLYDEKTFEEELHNRKEIICLSKKIALTEEKIALVESELKQVQEKRSKEKIISIEEALSIEQLEVRYPSLKSNKPGEVPKDILSNYQKVKKEQLFRELLIKRLDVQLDSLSIQKQEQSRAINKTRINKSEFEKKAKEKFQNQKSLDVFAYTSLFTFIFLLIVSLLVKYFDKKVSTIRVKLLWCISLIPLGIILLPKTFVTAGMILGVFVMIPLLITISKVK